MSNTYAGIFTMVLSQWLPYMGLQIGSEQITSFIATGAMIVGALWSMYGRYRLGGVSLMGLRTK